MEEKREQSLNPLETGTSGETVLRSNDAAPAAAKTGTAAPGAEVRLFPSLGGWRLRA